MKPFLHHSVWDNYTLGHSVSGPNSTQDSCEWLSHCLRLIMGRLHEKKNPQLDPAFLFSSWWVFGTGMDCSLQSWVTACSWGKGCSMQGCKQHLKVPGFQRGGVVCQDVALPNPVPCLWHKPLLGYSHYKTDSNQLASWAFLWMAGMLLCL